MKNQTPLFLQGGHLKPKKTNNMPLDPKQQPPYYEVSTTPAGAPYTAYVSRISQTGTGAPTGQPQYDTIEGVWTRQDVGRYRYTKTGAFTQTKAWGIALGNDITASSITVDRGTDDYMLVSTRSLTNPATYLDDCLFETPVEFRSYQD